MAKTKTVLVTGAAGLIGSEAVRYFSAKGYRIVGIDNDMRKYFFGDGASTEWNRKRLEEEIPGYTHYAADIRSQVEMEPIFANYGSDLDIIIHTAAQPSHDWAAKEPFTDFSVNANGTLMMLELTRQYAGSAVFIFTSTNKVYGDHPNFLPLRELETRWEPVETHPYASHGIDEQMSVDATKHSLFGASKVAADILVQEYGKYFGMKTVAFRGGCLTGPQHSGTQLHGFLSYLMKCAITGSEYTVFGYKMKQVRDNIHSYDLVSAFDCYAQAPRCGEVYNMGGSRHANCSMMEAIRLCERITGKKVQYAYTDSNRVGDHIWWISDVRKFQKHYPEWEYRYTLDQTLLEIYEGMRKRI
jgi:CDP-paratose 2-epimerase